MWGQRRRIRCNKGLVAKYGDERCFNTPLTEGLIGGLAVGLGLMAIAQLVNFNLRITFCLTNQSIVIRGLDNALQNKRRLDCADRLSDPYGGGVRGGLYHSQSTEKFCGQPGLRVVTL